ncbi:L-carnitine dehydrogenase [Psychrobacillus soli]|uniref:L-carnitine dehydrogenase n=1 Tax=Psychrobacillus soli TaxID=1543965 RepID=A0A544TDT1_9BACI|nr:L-carnitine dehydrogenase [Psychrobacillus soli]TQR15595.1 L-carnitine dehydrogenase [Psychrobacillus soli]
MKAEEIKNVAIIGAGVIGAGWAARCLHRGFNVYVSDPAPNAKEVLDEVITNAESALQKIISVPEHKKGKLYFMNSIKEAVENADYIQESAPEVEKIKISILNEIDKYSKPDAIIGTSTSGLLPTRLQSEMMYPERLVVAHPFNPVYILPLVEICGGEKTAEETKEEAEKFYRLIGMHPLLVRKEIDGFIADRLLEALWREILHLINDGIATTGEIDDAISYGAGLRWAIMGTNMTYYLAGGKRGMRHFMEQFGPTLKLPWAHIEAPELTNKLIDEMVEGTAEQAEGKDLREWEALRDNCLVDIMEALAKNDHGAGKVLKEDRETQAERLTLEYK